MVSMGGWPSGIPFGQFPLFFVIREGHEQREKPLSPVEIPRAVDGDPEYPASETIGLLKGCQVFVCQQKDVLRQIFCVPWRTNPVVDHSKNLSVKHAHQSLKGPPFTLFRLGDEGGDRDWAAASPTKGSAVADRVMPRPSPQPFPCPLPHLTAVSAPILISWQI